MSNVIPFRPGSMESAALETGRRIVHMLAPMTETKPEASAPPTPRLWTPAGFREDEWIHAESADALAGNGRFILPLQVFLGLDPEQRRSAKERLGVFLQPGA